MRAIILALTAFTWLAGCEEEPSIEERTMIRLQTQDGGNRTPTQADLVETERREARRADCWNRAFSGEITYFKDGRTGLCFAYAASGRAHATITMTVVPCEPAVEGLLCPEPRFSWPFVNR